REEDPPGHSSEILERGSAPLLAVACSCEDRRTRTTEEGAPHERPSRPPRRRADPAAVPLALARQVVPADPPHPDPDLPLDRVHPDDDRRLLRDALHGPLPARHLRLQPRRTPLDVARRLLQLQRACHRPLSAVL